MSSNLFTMLTCYPLFYRSTTYMRKFPPDSWCPSPNPTQAQLLMISKPRSPPRSRSCQNLILRAPSSNMKNGDGIWATLGKSPGLYALRLVDIINLNCYRSLQARVLPKFVVIKPTGQMLKHNTTEKLKDGSKSKTETSAITYRHKTKIAALQQSLSKSGSSSFNPNERKRNSE